MAPKRPKFSTQKPPDRFKTQLLSQVSQNVFGKSLSTSLNILCFHFLKVCVVCVKFIFLSPSLKFYWRIHCKPKKPNFFNLGPLCLPTPVGRNWLETTFIKWVYWSTFFVCTQSHPVRGKFLALFRVYKIAPRASKILTIFGQKRPPPFP